MLIWDWKYIQFYSLSSRYKPKMRVTVHFLFIPCKYLRNSSHSSTHKQKLRFYLFNFINYKKPNKFNYFFYTGKQCNFFDEQSVSFVVVAVPIKLSRKQTLKNDHHQKNLKYETKVWCFFFFVFYFNYYGYWFRSKRWTESKTKKKEIQTNFDAFEKKLIILFFCSFRWVSGFFCYYILIAVNFVLIYDLVTHTHYCHTAYTPYILAFLVCFYYFFLDNNVLLLCNLSLHIYTWRLYTYTMKFLVDCENARLQIYANAKALCKILIRHNSKKVYAHKITYGL